MVRGWHWGSNSTTAGRSDRPSWVRSRKPKAAIAQERIRPATGRCKTVQYNPECSKDKWLQAALTIEGKIGNWDLTATGGHLRRKTETESDYSDYAYFYDALAGYGGLFLR